MTEPKPTTCVCEKVLGIQNAVCDSSVSFICEYLESQNKVASSFRRNGTELEPEQAAAHIKQLLHDAQYPLIAGHSCVGVKNQQLVVDIGRKFQAVIDPTLQPKTNSIAPLTREGLVTASLGEAISRSDTIIVVGDSLAPFQVSLVHSILDTKHSANFISIGAPQDKSFEQVADCTRIQTENERIENVLLKLETTVQGLDRTQSPSCRSNHPDLEQQEIRRVSKIIANSQYVTIINNYCDNGFEFQTVGDSIHRVAKTLHDRTKAVVMNLNSRLNSVGAENVSTWSTGFPGAVDLSQGLAQSFGTEYSATNLMVRRECDVVVLFGDQVLDYLKSQSDLVDQLAEIPVVHFYWNKAQSIRDEFAQINLTEILNLGLFPDDFVRFDDLVFEVVSPPDLATHRLFELSRFLEMLISKKIA